MVFAFWFMILYMAPSIWAAYKGSGRFWVIFTINILAGWTVIGWVIAAVIYSKSKNTQSPTVLKFVVCLAPVLLVFIPAAMQEHRIENMTPGERQAYDKQQAEEKDQRERDAIAKANEKAKAKAEQFCNNKIDAFVLSQQFVERQLKSPSTAKFPTVSNDLVDVQFSDDCMATVYGFVDSQNGFGAMIRSTYKVEMQGTPYNETWKLKDITIH